MRVLFAVAMVVATSGRPSASLDASSSVPTPATDEQIAAAMSVCASNDYYMFEPDPELHLPTGVELRKLSPSDAIEKVRSAGSVPADAAREVLLATLLDCMGPFGPDVTYSAMLVHWREHQNRLLRADQIAPTPLMGAIAGRYVWKFHWGLSDADTRATLETVRPQSVAQFWLGRWLSFSDPGGSVRAYERSLSEQDSNDVRLWYAIELVRAERWQEGVKQLARLPADLQPRRVAFWKAKALAGLKRYDEARGVLRTLVSDPPPKTANGDHSWAEVLGEPGSVEGNIACERGDVEQALGNFDEAIRWYRSTWCEGSLGQLLYRQGKWFDAMLALQRDSQNAQALVDIYQHLQATKTAIDYLRGLVAECDSERGKDLPAKTCSWARAELEKLSAAVPDADVEVFAPGVTARLAAPRTAIAEEIALSDSERERRPTPSLTADSFTTLPVPTNAVVFAARDGKRVLVVSLSRDLDPAGEVSRGGYWISESEDGGRTWKGPYATGLTEGFPYVIKDSSRVTPFSGETIRVEAVRMEVDTQSITFPPIRMHSAKTRDDFALSISWSALVADSDGDGLTDLYEERIAADPHKADTDADGLRDGEDPMPLSAAGSTRDEDDALVARGLSDILHGDAWAHVVAPNSTGLEKIVGRPLPNPASSGAVLFVQSSWPRFQGVHLDNRIIVLSPKAVDAYRKKFGPAFYPVQIGNVIWNEDHTKGYFDYSFGWKGGSFLIERSGGDWKILPYENWIS